MNRKKWLPVLLCVFLLAGGCGQEAEENAGQDTEQTEEKQEGQKEMTVYEENECLTDQDESGQIEFAAEASWDVQVDFGQPKGLPLLKKISQFTVGTDKLTNVAANAKYLKELRAPTMRYPLSIWGTDYSDKLVKYWVKDAYDNVGELFAHNGTPVMYWHLAQVESAYNYDYGGGSQENVAYNPPLLPVYTEAWKEAAAYIRESGHRAYYEVLNECDHDAWYNGTWQEYVDIYTATAKALREGDPYAEVGGLSSGGLNRLLGQEGLDLFLNTVEAQGAPLDFASYHDYFQQYQQDTDMLARALDRSDYFNQTQMHLNEFNVYWPEDVYSQEKTGDDFLKTSQAVPLILDALEYFSRHPEITMVHWGCFSDVSEGLDLFTEEGEPLASYYALKTYQNMPVERVHAETALENIHVMASGNEKECGALLWNSEETPQELSLLLKGIPGRGGMLEVYRIDESHASSGEGGTAKYEPLEAYGNLTGEAVTWKGTVPSKGTVYIRWIAAGSEGPSEDLWPSQLGRMVRKHYEYQDRSKNVYGEFDERTGTVYLGMGDYEEGVGRCGVTLREIAGEVSGRILVTGCTREEDRGTIGIRIDYGTGENVYGASAYLLLGGREPEYQGYPWGTGENPGQVLTEAGDTFTLPIARLAPKDWTGECILSFELLDMQAGGAAIIQF